MFRRYYYKNHLQKSVHPSQPIKPQDEWPEGSSRPGFAGVHPELRKTAQEPAQGRVTPADSAGKEWPVIPQATP